MNAFLQFGLSNTLIAGVLALVALLVTRWWRNPHATRAIWLIVLVKLLMPPLMTFSWPEVLGPELSPSVTTEFVEPSVPLALVADGLQFEMNEASIPLSSSTAARTWSWEQIAWGLIAMWLVGSAVVIAMSVYRIARFHRMLSQALPASDSIERLVDELSRQVELRHKPFIRLVQAGSPPFVWPLGSRCTIVLPLRLVNSLDRNSLSDVVLHELAHIRRGDQWVRWLEVAATAVHWWNPILWLARRELHQVEETCCDAWVVAEFPTRRKSYTLSLLAAAEELLPCKRPASLAVAAFSRRSLLTQRVELLLHSAPTKGLSTLGLIAMALMAVVAWPCAASWVATEEIATSTIEASMPDRNEDLPPTNEQDIQKNSSVISAAKQSFFAIGVLSEDGKGVQIIRSIGNGKRENASTYKWANVEVLNARGERQSRASARRALTERRVVVAISGTRPIEDYAPVWSALAADTPVIRLMAPGSRQIKQTAPPVQLRSIEHSGGTIKTKD